MLFFDNPQIRATLTIRFLIAPLLLACQVSSFAADIEPISIAAGELATYSPDGKFLASVHDGTLHVQSLEEINPLSDVRIAQWFRDLDSNQFSKRHRAYNELKKLGSAVSQQIDQHLKSNESLEVQHRLKSLKKLLSSSARFRYKRRVRRLVFSANSEFIALGGDDRSVSVWRTASGQRERELANLDSSIHSLSFSPDGNWVAVGNGSGTIELFDRRRANRSTLFMGHTSAVHGLAFSNNGKRLYSAGGFDKRIGSWNTENLGGIKRNVEHLEGWIGKHKDSVLALAVSKNGQQLVVGGYDKSMQVWDLQTEKPIAQFNTNGETIRELQFFGNDTKIISAADDGFVRVWDVKTQTQSGAIAASVGAVRSFSIHPDGTKLAVSGADKQVSTWDFQAALQSMSK